MKVLKVDISLKDLKVKKCIVNSSLRYDKIVAATDMDNDGNAIFGLLINFFAKYWKELFEEQKVLRVLTPLYVAFNKKEKKIFYYQTEFDNWSKDSKTDLKKWEIRQKKGLASLEDEEYSLMLNNPVFEIVELDENYKESLDAWFGSDSNKRKIKLKEN